MGAPSGAFPDADARNERRGQLPPCVQLWHRVAARGAAATSGGEWNGRRTTAAHDVPRALAAAVKPLHLLAEWPLARADARRGHREEVGATVTLGADARLAFAPRQQGRCRERRPCPLHGRKRRSDHARRSSRACHSWHDERHQDAQKHEAWRRRGRWDPASRPWGSSGVSARALRRPHRRRRRQPVAPRLCVVISPPDAKTHEAWRRRGRWDPADRPWGSTGVVSRALRRPQRGSGNRARAPRHA